MFCISGNSVDPYQMQHSVAFDLGLCWLWLSVQILRINMVILAFSQFAIICPENLYMIDQKGCNFHVKLNSQC